MPRLSPSSEDRVFLRTLQVLALAAGGMAVLLALVPAGGHDQLWFLLMADRWIHGAQLYGPEMFDSNTPAIVWLSAVPVGVAEAIHVDASTVGKAFVIAVAAAVGWASYRIVFPRDTRAGSGSERARRYFFAFAFISVFAVAAARDFGQRDHLAALLCMPYVLAAGGRSGNLSRWVRWLCAVAAGCGVCLKPQLALIPVSIEALRWARGRRAFWRSLEAWTVLGVCGAFLLSVRWFAAGFFALALPTVLATYWAIGHLSALELLRQSVQLHVLGCLAVALHVVAERRSRLDAHDLRPVSLCLLTAGAAATVAYYIQGTGWYYQQLPAIGFLGLALCVDAWILRATQVRLPKALPMVAAALGLLALLLTAHFSGYPLAQDMFSADNTYAISSPDPAFFRGLAPGTSVATLTTSVDDALMPVFRYRLTWAQRTNNLWLLPAVFRATRPATGERRPPARLTPARVAEVSAQQRRWMVEDLKRWKPSLVLVEQCQAAEVACQELEGRHDDLLGFFLTDPEFVAVWRGYHFARRLGAYAAYERVSVPAAD